MVLVVAGRLLVVFAAPVVVLVAVLAIGAARLEATETAPIDGEQLSETPAGNVSPEPDGANPQIATADRRARDARVFRHRVDPHWFADNNRFWYRNQLPEERREFVVVDCLLGTREPAFDHAEVARQIGGETRPDQLPVFHLRYSANGQSVRLIGRGASWEWDPVEKRLSKMDENADPAIDEERLVAELNMRPSSRTGEETAITFDNRLEAAVEIFWLEPGGARTSYGKLPPGARRQQHTFTGHRWLVLKEDGESQGVFEAIEFGGTAILDGTPPRRSGRRNGDSRTGNGQEGTDRGRQSPDGKWSVLLRDHNLVLVASSNGEERVLSRDGSVDNPYDEWSWSPDSRTLASFRREPGERKEVYLVQSSPDGGGRARLQSRPYAQPGDRFPTYELNIFDVESCRQYKPAVDRFEHEWQKPQPRWSPDSSRLRYSQVDRGHQRFRVLDLEAATGSVRALVDERTETFLWTAHTEGNNLPIVQWLQKSDGLIHVSERSGWRHLYLINAATGEVKNPITSGEWVVRGLDRVDEETGQVWFRASGCVPGQDPYLIHYGRVGLDGTGLVWLTAGDGTHTVQYSPDGRFLIDTYSRVDAGPTTELRRIEDGRLLVPLETADLRPLKAIGWEPPEVFRAKGRDGVTDIWGIICRPRNLDPNRKYPVIEEIYAGPHDSHVPKAFSPQTRYESLIERGFIVVKIDGMGTANRSKAFHDRCWKNLKDAGFEDRICWIRAAAEAYAYFDLERVGIYGGSAGGQNAAAAVLFHPDFYRVAVAGCGCHDNRLDKASWNEQWMGYPVGPEYALNSNIDNAHRLDGKLLLIVGELDTNVPPESTLRFADALIRHNKDFEMLVVPNAGHGMGGAYGVRRMHEFFERHLKPGG